MTARDTTTNKPPVHRARLSTKNGLGRRFVRDGALLFRIQITELEKDSIRATVDWLNAPDDPAPKRSRRVSQWTSIEAARHASLATIRAWVDWITDGRDGVYSIHIEVSTKRLAANTSRRATAKEP